MKCGVATLLLFLAAFPLYAGNSLLYLEAQGVAGYQRLGSEGKEIYRSSSEDDVMQLNSVGIDFIKKFSLETGDIGSAALQARLAYNENKKRAEPQIYNAYLKAKTQYTDIWAGHDRVAFGLASFWDTHGDLLQPLPMYGFGFDRDWGMGISKDTERGDLKIALTSGTGMRPRAKGNWLVTSRASYGVLSYDNYNIGIAGMAGQKPEVMGYELIDKKLKETALLGIDFSFNFWRFENKAELNAGEKDKKRALAAFYRLGVNFLEENRLKLEGQYAYTEQDKTRNHAAGAGIAFKLNSWLTARLMYEWRRGRPMTTSETDDGTGGMAMGGMPMGAPAEDETTSGKKNEHRFVGQLYAYYFAL
jgi:hypothetical protein